MVEPDDPLVVNVVGRHKAGRSVDGTPSVNHLQLTLSINSGDTDICDIYSIHRSTHTHTDSTFIYRFYTLYT